MNRTEGKVFVITGSAQGIGRELGAQVLSLGGTVVFNSRSGEKIARVDGLLKQYADRCLFVAADVSVAAEAELLIAETVKRFGRIDVLVNNAGLSGYGPLSETSPVAMVEIIGANLLGSVYATRFALPHLISSKGGVLFVSSLAALHGLPGYSLYSSSKMALTALYQSLKKELHPQGVFVGIAYVGFTQNDGGKKTYAPDGTLESVPERNKFSVATQNRTAKLLLRQLQNRNALKVHSAMGKFAYVISRLFPSLLDRIYQRNYTKSAD